MTTTASLLEVALNIETPWPAILCRTGFWIRSGPLTPSSFVLFASQEVASLLPAGNGERMMFI